MERKGKTTLSHHEQIRNRIFGIFICFSSTYTLVVRYTGFFMASRLEKTISIIAALVVAGLIYFLLPKKIFRIQQLVSNLKPVILGAILSLMLIGLVFNPLYFPEDHSLEILPEQQEGAGNLIIESINRVEFPKGEKLTIAPSQMDIEDDWNVDGSTGSITWLGDFKAKLAYSRLMQAGVEIVFITGSEQGRARIIWDGKEQIIDLYAPFEGSQVVFLKPELNWFRTGIIQKILVGAAYLTQFIALTALISFISLLPKLFVFRHHKTVLISVAILLLLFLVVQILDPIVTFKDPQLEYKIRESLGLPEGDIRSHHVLTIAKLDFSACEIQELDGIQNLYNLVSLDLRDNAITSIAPISKLHKLRDLNLRGNAIHDISPLVNLTKIESINLRDNPIVDLTPLRSLPLIKDLNLSGIPLEDHIYMLSDFSKLEYLNIRNCYISDISPLAEMMARGIIQDDPISGTKAELDIRDNPIPRLSYDGYASIRPYWEKISYRAPFILPVIDDKEPPKFSHSAGFYQSNFWLEISTPSPDVVVHFTLDGSEPTINSPQYEQPILISDRSGQPNQLSAINNISPKWKAPIGEVYKATVLRASAFYPDGMKSMTVTSTFFIGQKKTNRYSIPIIALNTDYDFLFGDTQGIYTIGNISGSQEIQSANYYKRGGEWERPINIEFFDGEGNLLITQDGGIRIHGATTRGYPQKSLSLYADLDYGQSDFFSATLFPGLTDSVKNDPITNFKTLLLRNSGNNLNHFLYRDSLIQALVDPEIIDIQASQPVVVFLNGEYWGIYNLRENLDANYLSSHYQVDPQDVVILENNSQLNFGQQGDEDTYKGMLDFILENDISFEENYNFVSTLMDMENYIDYQISEIYARNENWPHDNIKYWHYKMNGSEVDLPKGQDGKWRWLLFDLDTAFGIVGGENAYQDNTLIEAEGEFLFRSLLNNPTFRTKFINRFADQLNTFYSPRRVTKVVAEMESVFTPVVQEHLVRWNIMGGLTQEWKNNLDVIKTFANERPAYVRQHIIDRFNLAGMALVILKADNEKGHICINTIDILPTTPGVLDSSEWNGIYFKNVPITITAIPNPGYKFAGWEGSNSAESVIIVTLEDNMELTARFVQEE